MKCAVQVFTALLSGPCGVLCASAASGSFWESARALPSGTAGVPVFLSLIISLPALYQGVGLRRLRLRGGVHRRTPQQNGLRLRVFFLPDGRPGHPEGMMGRTSTRIGRSTEKGVASRPAPMRKIGSGAAAMSKVWYIPSLFRRQALEQTRLLSERRISD